MPKSLELLNPDERKRLVQEIIDKKNGENDKDWLEFISEYDLACAADTLRKAGVGIKMAYDAGLGFRNDDQDSINRGMMERQKLYDIQRGIRKDIRETSRSEMLREVIGEAIKNLPEIKLKRFYTGKPKKTGTKSELVVGMGDFHYGANFIVTGLYGEEINKYNSQVFEERMMELMHHIMRIVEKEKPEQVTIMIVGDMLDGMLRQSQLQRLEYGVVDSAMRLSETLAKWFASLEEIIQLPIRVYAVRGNHGEIRPLGSKAGQFPEENMERVIMHYLHARFADSEWIMIAEDDAPINQIVDVCGFQFMLTHGQGMNIESMARDSVNLYNKPIDIFMVGHLHKGQTFQSGIKSGSNVYVERVPSLCGVDPYAQSLGYGGYAGATAILMEEKYGRRCIYPIVLK